MRLGFDGLSRVYRALEFAALGRGLERARFAHVAALSGCREVLLLGDGDGRFAQKLAEVAPRARITSVDSSAGMLAESARRNASAASRIRFVHSDALAFQAAEGSFDGAAALFFLDCFPAAKVEALAESVGRWLRPDAPLLYADFAVPPRGLPRLQARACLSVLYPFFRWQAGIEAQELPPSEEILMACGWRTQAEASFRGGMLRSAVLRRGAPTAARAASPSPARPASR
ncbi:MAG TPA: class I SAM-dependent methyltransferase [Opitutaceae bacterium]|jgi:SAM-dependent methyltransferase